MDTSVTMISLMQLINKELVQQLLLPITPLTKVPSSHLKITVWIRFSTTPSKIILMVVVQ